MLVAAITIVATTLVSANLAGYCVEERRYLSDEELVLGAISRGSFHRAIQSRMDDGTVKQAPRIVTSKTLLEQFPDCCEVTGEDMQPNRQPFWRKAVGDFRGYVSFFVTLEGQNSEDVTVGPLYVALTNCGEPWNGIAIGR